MTPRSSAFAAGFDQLLQVLPHRAGCRHRLFGGRVALRL